MREEEEEEEEEEGRRSVSIENEVDRQELDSATILRLTFVR